MPSLLARLLRILGEGQKVGNKVGNARPDRRNRVDTDLACLHHGAGLLGSHDRDAALATV